MILPETRRLAIIGAGPAGLAVARSVFHDPLPFEITIFEAKSQPGGVWVYNGKGPVYRDLDTNIFKELMEYKDFHFPSSLPTYPGREDVFQYILNYSKHVHDHPQLTEHDETKNSCLSKARDGRSLLVRWDSAVTDVTKAKADGPFLLEVNGQKEEFDFVVVASGHFEKPLLPKSIDGLKDFFAKHPDKIMHTRTYDNPDGFKGQRVLVIGNGSSGTDLIIQLRSTAQSPVNVSRRNEQASDAVFEAGNDVNWLGEVQSIDDNGIVTFVDGHTDQFDRIILATGYHYTFPFLQNLGKDSRLRQASDTLPYSDIPLLDGEELRVPNLHKYVFYVGDPRLAFAALNKNVVPMPLAECQGSVIARVFGGRLQLPTTEEMLKEERELVGEKGDGLGYLQLGYPHDVAYMHLLNDWAGQAPEGFEAERWGEHKADLRSRVAEAKLGDYKRKLELARKAAR